jgi:prevent-host-death family protein
LLEVGLTHSSRRRRPARWSLQDAKNKLSAVVDAAAAGAPQIVTRRGVETAVIISYEEYERIMAGDRKSPSMVQHLIDIPRAPGDEELDRIELSPRAALVD